MFISNDDISKTYIIRRKQMVFVCV